MQNKKTKELTLLAILTALSVTFGFVAKIPTPTGLLTLVDAGIYFTAFYLGKKEGAIVGGLSAFSDRSAIICSAMDVYQFVNPWCTRLFCWI